MKIFRVVRDYTSYKIYEIVIADDEEEVYELTGWTKEDKPELEIKEIEFTKGVKLSISHQEFHPLFKQRKSFFDEFLGFLEKGK